jgi:hypothetical protein
VLAMARGRLGHLRQAANLLAESNERMVATHATLFRTLFLAEHATLRIELGELDEATSLLEEARGHARSTGERFWLCEVLRLEARIRSLQGAHRCTGLILQEALGVARMQRSRALSLRAASTWVELARGDEERSAALATLEKCAAVFQEGRETVDWIRARALLQAD